jgi:SAM-dependent methyltransferase
MGAARQAGNPKMIDNADVWRSMLQRQGHTGWNNPAIYAYDQLERLRLVANTVRELRATPAPHAAIDFGCGSGDFSKVLLELGFSVHAYDPVTHPEIDDPRYRFSDSLEALLQASSHVGLILSVTVLDHILDNDRLGQTLAALRGTLHPGGHLVLLEYALDAPFQGRPGLRANGHQAFRSSTRWQEALWGAGFRVQHCAPAPHPVHSPSPGYERYARRLDVRALRWLRLAGTRMGRRALSAAAAAALERAAGDPEHATASPLVCMICTTR